MSEYDRLLNGVLDKIAAEVGESGLEFTQLNYEVLITGPTGTNFALVLWRGDQEVTTETLGDGWWSLTLGRELRALRAASVVEGRGDFNAMTLTLFPDGKFDLDFAYPEPTGAER